MTIGRRDLLISTGSASGTPATLNQVKPRFPASCQLRHVRQHRPAMGDLAFVQFGHAGMVTRTCDSPGHT
jgi:hypothetical protein